MSTENNEIWANFKANALELFNDENPNAPPEMESNVTPSPKPETPVRTSKITKIKKSRQKMTHSDILGRKTKENRKTTSIIITDL